ncbi:MAG: FkbM family methyltransferase [Chloroflexales bacterium]|nr:FkbM family methyltransferase [Chloroflexales bacterium]
MSRIASSAAGDGQDPGLRLVLSLTHRLSPRVRGAGRLAQALARLYSLRLRGPQEGTIRGFRMRLDPSEFLERVLLFYPQYWDAAEISFLERSLRPGDTFVDIGAHVGFYTLAAARAVAPGGLVLSAEAAPTTYRKLCHNLALNGVSNVRAVQRGVADQAQTLRLGLNGAGNRAANSFLFPSPQSVAVPCAPLLDLLREQGIDRVAGAKLDIEGFEHRVLARFLADAAPALWPAFLIVERNPAWVAAAGGDVVELLKAYGYSIYGTHDHNHIMVRAG